MKLKLMFTHKADSDQPLKAQEHSLLLRLWQSGHKASHELRALAQEAVDSEVRECLELEQFVLLAISGNDEHVFEIIRN